MTPERIAELRRLLTAATPCPWRDTWAEVADGKIDEQFAIVTDAPAITHPTQRCIVGLIEYDGENIAIHKENAALIVAAVNSLDDLLTEIEYLRSELRR
jgi:hypothetical protein